MIEHRVKVGRYDVVMFSPTRRQLAEGKLKTTEDFISSIRMDGELVGDYQDVDQVSWHKIDKAISNELFGELPLVMNTLRRLESGMDLASEPNELPPQPTLPTSTESPTSQ